MNNAWNLPKTLHLYWGQNQPLSYIRYLTVLSFAKLNPDWIINVWTPSEVSTLETPWTTGEQSGEYFGYDYLDDLQFYRKEIDMERIGIPNNTPEVHKSDLLRWYLLGTYGGVWSDFDVLYIQPLSDEITKNWKGAGLCYYELPLGNKQVHKFQAIGFLASAGESGKEFFTQIFEKGLSKIPQTEYQAFGAKLLPDVDASPESVFYIDKNLVYPYHSHHSVQIYFNQGGLQIKNSIGLHWYAGHPINGKAAASITGKNIRDKTGYSICKEALKII